MTLAGYEHLLSAARRLQWDAEAIDLRADAAAWPALPAAARARVGALVAGFCLAEQAVAEHLPPFADAAVPDALARECFLVQAGDERRHARFFERVAAEVTGGDGATAAPTLATLFRADLPALAARLSRGEASLAEAVGLYHLVLEGIVFAIGQRALEDELRAVGGALPGTLDGVLRVQADERWHVGLGVMCLQDRGLAADVAALAAQAAAAWGPQLATPARVDAVLAVHARRLAQVARGAVPTG